MSSKLDKADAQEWLESLQQVGDGWWRQVALAVRAGAHKSLGMDRREFVQVIGQRLIEPREAIIELHKEGHSREAISAVLSVSKNTVKNLLIEEGLIEGTVDPTHQPKALSAGQDSAEETQSDGLVVDGEAVDLGEENDRLKTAIEELVAQVKGAEKKRKDDADAAKKKLAELRKSITEERRKAKEEAEAALTEADRERLGKEAEAWAEEQGRKVLAGLSHLVVDSIVGNLEEAAEEVRMLIEQQAVTTEAVSKIESARAGFDEEFNVARMSVEVNEGRAA